jgi:preprotein translocase subunit SecE
MFQPENQKYVMKNELVNVTSSTIITLIFLAFFSFFLFFSEVLFADAVIQ